MAAVAASIAAGDRHSGDGLGRGPSVASALDRLAGVDEVAGRFSTANRRGRPVRLLLAKNPAGWAAIFDLLEEGGPTGSPIVLSINARIADGLDTSWLWDVPFERLGGGRWWRPATAGSIWPYDCTMPRWPARWWRTRWPQSTTLSDRAGDASRAAVDFLGNYTAFAEARQRLEPGGP